MGDESKRFGLNAFKGLGGSYALGRVIADKLGKDVSEVGEIPAGSFTFVTATDGNHGRGVAWAAKNLKQKAVVYMPKLIIAEPDKADCLYKTATANDGKLHVVEGDVTCSHHLASD